MSYSLGDLSRETGVGVHRIRWWVRRGWLHGAHPNGSNARYGDDHVERVKAIVELRRRKVAASDVHAIVSRASRDELRDLIGLPPLAPPSPAASPTSAARSFDDAALLRVRVEAIVCLAAEQLDVSPRGLRAPLARIFERMQELCVDPSEAVSVLRSSAQ
jgi:DNA-binding transcriptional MerR regulator